jgi:collagenase-like PrtC family protease
MPRRACWCGRALLSAGTFSLLHELSGLRNTGVDVLRISPQSNGTAQVVRLFRDGVHFGLNGEGFVAEPARPSDLAVRASSRDFLQLLGLDAVQGEEGLAFARGQ